MLSTFRSPIGACRHRSNLWARTHSWRHDLVCCSSWTKVQAGARVGSDTLLGTPPHLADASGLRGWCGRVLDMTQKSPCMDMVAPTASLARNPCSAGYAAPASLIATSGPCEMHRCLQARHSHAMRGWQGDAYGCAMRLSALIVQFRQNIDVLQCYAVWPGVGLWYQDLVYSAVWTKPRLMRQWAGTAHSVPYQSVTPSLSTHDASCIGGAGASTHVCEPRGLLHVSYQACDAQRAHCAEHHSGRIEPVSIQAEVLHGSHGKRAQSIAGSEFSSQGLSAKHRFRLLGGSVTGQDAICLTHHRRQYTRCTVVGHASHPVQLKFHICVEFVSGL